MSRLIVLRHGPTAWNERGAIQGRADPPLSSAGRDRVRSWRLPAEFSTGRWIASPLRRAIETARLMGGDPVPDPRLLELDWGDHLQAVQAQVATLDIRDVRQDVTFRDVDDAVLHIFGMNKFDVAQNIELF